jgi:flagellar biosynthesis/type III secretory pathway chaperone
VSTLVATGDLASVLIEESELCEQLLSVTDREHAAIVSSDIEGLTSLVEEKEHLLELLATLETERMTALTAIALAVGQPADALTLTSIGVIATPGTRAQLLAAGEGLRTTGEALASANARNADLLAASTDLVERWVSYLKTVISSTLATYSNDGNAQAPGGNRVLDRSA